MTSEMNRGLPELPEGWKWIRLGDEFKWGSGGTPLRKESSYYYGEIPWAVIGDLNDGVVSSTKETITEEGFKNSSVKWVEEGSLLIAMYGSIGKLGIAGKRLTTNQAIAFTKTNPVTTKYLFYYLLKERLNLNSLGIGNTQKNISQTIIKSISIPFPSIDEQFLIISKIEELFTQLDAGVAALERARKLLRRYRQAVLHAAVTGELTKEWRETHQDEIEPASKLLERMLVERRARWEGERKESHGNSALSTYKEPERPSSEKGLPIPKEWMHATVEQVGFVGLGRQRSPKHHTGPNMRTYIRAANLTWNGLDLSDVMEMDFSPADFKTYELKPGDVLLSEASGSIDEVGKPAIWNGEIQSCCFQNTIIRVRTIEGILPAYLYIHFLNDSMNSRFRQIARGLGIHHIGANRLSGFVINLPSLEEQRIIVDEVERRLSVVKEIENTVKITLAKGERLRKAILDQAFSGKLIPYSLEQKPGFAEQAPLQDDMKTHPVQLTFGDDW